MPNILTVSSPTSDANHPRTLIHQNPVLRSDSIPLIIEVVGIITTVTTCLLMHLIMKKSHKDADRPTFHHLIHQQYYNEQLDKFLNEQAKRNEVVRDLLPWHKRDSVKSMRECLFAILKACDWVGLFRLQNLHGINFRKDSFNLCSLWKFSFPFL